MVSVLPKTEQIYKNNLSVDKMTSLEALKLMIKDQKKVFNIISKSIDILEKESITLIIEDIISKLCSRIGDIPYPEVTEELRLLILTILNKIVLYVNILQSEDLKVKLADIVVNMLPRSLQDAFPAAKKEAAELLCKISSILCFETSICTGFNASLKILTSNATFFV